jgi:hypothetical protein
LRLASYDLGTALLNGQHKAITTPIRRFDDPLLASTVAQKSTNQPEATSQGSVAHKRLRPEVLDQFLLRNHTATMLNEVGENTPCLAFELDGHASAA